ncbi:acyltransferase family protein [Serratia oryzae]|uniref:Acyltransferase n=1 Tax=Serratia oryzae TaxID=2034155 RepID=A0A1S8CN11_9GAMM|nr:acyltransferase [Serratia oryzae]OMQ26756.1 acyltransferase [Serratia oryzae]
MTYKTASQIISRDGNNLDLIRLLASISVIIYHSFALNPQWGLIDPIKNTFGYVTTGGLAVKIFFFISGILVANSLITRKSIYHFIVSRFLRIFPGLLFVLFISSFLIGPVLSTLPFRDYISSGEVYSYFFNNIILDTRYFLPGVLESNKYGVNGSLWTIRYEVIAYIVLLALFLTGVNKNKIISSLVCAIIIVEPISPLKGYLFASSDNNAIYLLAPCFALGVLIAINKDSYKATMLLPVILFASQFLFSDNSIRSLLICFSACLFSFSLSSLSIVKKIKINNDISYGVYLWGFPIQQIYSQYLELSFIANVILSIVTAMIIALISWLRIEKPSIILGKKITKGFIPPYMTDSFHKKRTENQEK